MKKEVNIDSEKVTRVEQSIYWRGTREDKSTKQRGLSVTNLDGMNPSKPLIPEKYNNWMELNKLKRKK